MKRLSLVLMGIMMAAVMIFSSCVVSQSKMHTTATPVFSSPMPSTVAPAPPSFRPPATASAAPPASPVHPTPITSPPAPMPTVAPVPPSPVPSTVAPAPSSFRPPATASAAPPASPVYQTPTISHPAPLPTIAPVTSSGGGGNGKSGKGGGGAPAPAFSNSIGMAAGGAKDVSNFRENIRNNYLPQPTDVTYEGLFYDYYFDFGAAESTNKLCSPSYNYAVTRDPFSKNTEYYLSVGLSYGLKESNFQRKTLNLVIVLDKSGSMAAQYTRYYYDRFGKPSEAYAEEGINRLSKMRNANEAVISILDQLKSDDRLAIVTFNDSAVLEKSMNYVSCVDMLDIKENVREIIARGTTNLAAGLNMAYNQFNNLSDVNSNEYENRIIVLTDAQPNMGDLSSGRLENVLKDNANRRVYTTFIGVGVDFNSNLVEQITKIKGANYYSVHSPQQFRQRVAEEFDYMVTPLVFDLSLSFESPGWSIEKVFGSPEADKATGRVMKINTLFASKSEDGQTRGGLVLLKLQKTTSDFNAPVYLRTSYKDRNNRTDGDEQLIYLENLQPEYFDNNGIRKGILLSRYAALLKNWMIDERQHISYNWPWNPCISENTGIIVPMENISQWERQSMQLRVSGSYNRIFSDFASYLGSEMRAIGDTDLKQEMDILNMLSEY